MVLMASKITILLEYTLLRLLQKEGRQVLANGFRYWHWNEE